MDWLTFFSNMSSAFAWPLTVGAAAYFFRVEVRQIVSGMKRLKLGPMEAEMFEAQAREARQTAFSLMEHVPRGSVTRSEAEHSSQEHASNNPVPISDSDRAIDDLLSELLTPNFPSSPRLTIMSVWAVVEDAIRSFAEKYALNPNGAVITILIGLEDKNLITREERELLRKLYLLRHEAATSGQITEDSALDYTVAASTILRRLGLSDKPGRSSIIRATPLGPLVERQ